MVHVPHTCTHMLPLSVCTRHFILWMFVFLTLVPCVCPTTQPLSSESWTGILHNPAEERTGSDTHDPRKTSSSSQAWAHGNVISHCERFKRCMSRVSCSAWALLRFPNLPPLSAHLGFAGRSFFLTSGPKSSGTVTWKNYVSKVTLSV